MSHDPEEQNTWDFPDVNSEGGVENTHDFQEGYATEENVSVKTDKDPEIPAEAEPTEYEIKLKEVEILKHDCDVKLRYLGTLINKIESMDIVLDNDLIQIMQDIIQKVIKKIIHKELQTDPALLPSLILELKKLVPEQKKALISVMVSDADYATIKDAFSDAGFSLMPQADLAAGDIIVKSNAAEVRAILNDRIDQLLRPEHD
jgi:hypothetical protein